MSNYRGGGNFNQGGNYNQGRNDGGGGGRQQQQPQGTQPRGGYNNTNVNNNSNNYNNNYNNSRGGGGGGGHYNNNNNNYNTDNRGAGGHQQQNRFEALGAARSGGGGAANKDGSILEDLRDELPIWTLSCYGSTRSGPNDLLLGASFEEVRWRNLQDAAMGKSAPQIISDFTAATASKKKEFDMLTKASTSNQKLPSKGGTPITVYNEWLVQIAAGQAGSTASGTHHKTVFGQKLPSAPAHAPMGGTGTQFGQPVAFGGAQHPAARTLFGQQLPGAGGGFGQAAPPAGAHAFSQHAPPTLFGQPVGQPGAASTFGQPAPASAPTLFGQPVPTPGFGQPHQPVTAPTLFGQPTQPPATAPTLFGQPPAQQSLFGQPAQPPAAAPTLFGQPAPPTGPTQIGQPATAPFGAQQAPKMAWGAAAGFKPAVGQGAARAGPAASLLSSQTLFGLPPPPPLPAAPYMPQTQPMGMVAARPMAPAPAAAAAASAVSDGPTEEDVQAFRAPSFVRGKIPGHAPPPEMCA